MNTLSLKLPYSAAGLQDKPYSAINMITQTIGYDLYSSPGIMKVGNSMFNVSAALSGAIGAAPDAIVSVSTTVMYVFVGTAIYKYNPTTAALTSLTVASEATVNAIFFQTKVYFIGNTKIGTINISTDAVTNNVHTLTNGSTSNHPLQILRGNLYIGDKFYVAQVDSAYAFTANVFDLRTDLVISALQSVDSDLLIGAYSTQDGFGSEIFTWNTWSDFFTTEMMIQEAQKITNFMKVNNAIYFIISTTSNTPSIYSYSNGYCQKYMDFPSINLITKGTTFIYPNAITYYDNRCYIGVSGLASAGIYPGIYSFGSPLPGGKPILALEYGVSGSDLGISGGNNWEIHCLEKTGLGIYSGWANSSSGADYAFGVDTVSGSKNIGVQIRTGIIVADRQYGKDFDVLSYYARAGSTPVMTYSYLNFDTTRTVTARHDPVNRLMMTTGTFRSMNEMQLVLDMAMTDQQGFADITGIDLLFQ